MAEEGHFGRAALRLHVSQPALSQQILALEGEVGTPLLERRPRGVVLTPAGAVFLRHALDALAAAARAVDGARDAAQGLVGALRVGLPEARSAVAHVMRAVDEFARRHARVEIEASGLPWLQQPEAVLGRRLDVGCCWTPDPPTATKRLPSGLAGLRVFDDPGDCALLAEGHPLASRDALTAGDLRPYPWGLFDRSMQPALHGAIVRVLAAAGLGAGLPAPGVGSAMASVPLLFARRGWTLVTRSVAADPPGGTVARPIADVHVPAGLDLIWRRTDQRRLVRAFIKVAREGLAPVASRGP